ncbi:MAG: hypothetical protein EBU05_03070 [Chitinophagia bacterium]|jgi:uncharacterized membrane protein|nr:hypothetical protein [Chitinophagia bacterium]
MLDFIGHLHPLIVHLPIGILLLGVLMMVYQHFSKVDLRAPISLAFLVGSISAVLACIAGWILSNSGEYDALLVQKHQWTGISTAVIGLLVYFLKQYRKLLAVILTQLVFITGHYGGTLTHGENYLFKSNENSNKSQVDTIKVEAKKITQTISNGADSLTIETHNVYKEEIAPLLKLRCYNCHSAIKQKNGLRLDGEMFIKKGGKSGKIFVAGNTFKSPLYTSLVLPIDDEKHMPPKGKHQLSQNEILIIENWIKSGASFEDIIDTISNKEVANNITAANKIADKNILDDPKLKNAKAEITETKKKDIENNNIKGFENISNLPNPAPLSPAIIEGFKQENIILTNIAEGSNFVMANFVNVVPFNNAILQALKNINEQLVVLKLTNLPINDNDIKIVADLKNIKKLNVENTLITDNGMEYIKQLSKLEQLNLYGTNVSDEGLMELASLKNLSVLYLWKTKVTLNGIEQFKKINPKVVIEIGDFKFQKK